MVINKNIRISAGLKVFLDRNRLYPRETYDDIIKRISKWSDKR